MAIIFTPNLLSLRPTLAGFYLVKRCHPSRIATEYSFFDGEFFHDPMPSIWEAYEKKNAPVCAEVVAWAAMPTTRD